MGRGLHSADILRALSRRTAELLIQVWKSVQSSPREKVMHTRNEQKLESGPCYSASRGKGEARERRYRRTYEYFVTSTEAGSQQELDRVDHFSSM